MTRWVIAWALAALLAGCGADGEPVKPTANLGLNISSSGVTANTSVGVRKGPWTLSWGQLF